MRFHTPVKPLRNASTSRAKTATFVSQRIVGIRLESILVGRKRAIVTLQLPECVPFVAMRGCVIGSQIDRAFTGKQAPLVVLQAIKSHRIIILEDRFLPIKLDRTLISLQALLQLPQLAQCVAPSVMCRR